MVVRLSNGQVLRVPLLATVPLRDARGDTVWPSLAGAANGAASDWLVYLVEMSEGATRARFTVPLLQRLRNC